MEIDVHYDDSWVLPPPLCEGDGFPASHNFSLRLDKQSLQPTVEDTIDEYDSESTQTSNVKGQSGQHIEGADPIRLFSTSSSLDVDLPSGFDWQTRAPLGTLKDTSRQWLYDGGSSPSPTSTSANDPEMLLDPSNPHLWNEVLRRKKADNIIRKINCKETQQRALMKESRRRRDWAISNVLLHPQEIAQTCCALDQTGWHFLSSIVRPLSAEHNKPGRY